MKKIRKKFDEFYKIVTDPTVALLPGQIAFFLVLSLFPLILLVGYIVSMFGVSVNSLTDVLNDTLPVEFAEIISNFISGKTFDSTVGLSMIIGFILASNGAHAIILASNALYGFPNDDFVRRRVKALFLIVVLVSLFIFVVLVLAYGNIIAKLVVDTLNLPAIAKTIYYIFIIIKWPIAMILIYTSIKLIYVIAPDWHILSKNTTKGALITTIGWTVATAIFSFYVSHFSNYDIFYGSLSNVVIFMIWIYILSFILVIGIAYNVNEYNDDKEE